MLHKPVHVSDDEHTKLVKKSGYFKKYGKRAGRRLERRTSGKVKARVARDTKRLPW